MCRLDDDRDLSLEPIEMPCPSCGGDGGFDVPHGYDPRDGSLRTHWCECRTCGGSGAEFVEVLPVTFEDLEELDHLEQESATP
jgi:hypothetical protein